MTMPPAPASGYPPVDDIGKRSKFVRGLLIASGIICVGLAALGVFMPLLPTTPFLLLAAACFLRGSDRLYRWLIGHPVFGRYIRHYREDHAIPRASKIATLILLWGTILISALVFARGIWLRLGLIAVAIGVTNHLLRMKTLPSRPEE